MLEETLIRVSLRPVMADNRAELATDAVSASTSGGGRHWFWELELVNEGC